MHVQAVALVLGQHHDPVVAAVGQVGEREVDEPVVAAERNRRLGALAGQREQPLALAPGEHHRENPPAGWERCHGRPVVDWIRT